MRVEASDGRIVCVPYQFEKQNGGLVVTTNRCDNIAKVINSKSVGVQPNDIVVYDKKKAMEFVVDRKTYIVFSCDGMLAHIREEEETNND
jgi:co-chaperonin GroES (HSP10)